MHKKQMRGHIRERRKRIMRDAKKMAHELKQFSSDHSLKDGYSPEERKARKRVKEIKGYYEHLAAYISVNLFLFILNMMVTPTYLWCLFPLLGWGIGLFTHTVSIFGFFGIGGQKWEEQKVQEILGHNATREELERLSQRIESLATIISSVNWETLDPDVVAVNKSLLSASQEIQRELADPSYQDQRIPKTSKERLIKLTENLESIVTSPEFKYIDADYKGRQ